MLKIFSALVPETQNKVMTILFGIVMIILGGWLWSGIPMSGVAIGFFVGLQLLVAGVVWIALGLMARSTRETQAPIEAPA